MPQLAPLVLNDGTKDLTFAPQTIDKNGVAFLANRGLLPMEVAEVSISRNGTEKTGYKPRVKITLPITGLDPAGNTKVVDYEIVEISYRRSPLGTVASGKRLTALASNAVKSALVIAVTEGLEGVY